MAPKSDGGKVNRRPQMVEAKSTPSTAGNGANRLRAEDQAVHDWYRFVLSYPPHLVREYINRFEINSADLVLDPFCGTGTTLVECKKLGITSIGLEPNPMAHFASSVKTDWSVSAKGLLEHARGVAGATHARLEADGVGDTSIFSNGEERLRTLPQEQWKLLLTDSISPRPLHRTLVLLEVLEARRDDRYHRHELLALAKALVTSIGNLHFGPEVGVGRAHPEAAAVTPWLAQVARMAADLEALQPRGAAPSQALCADARAAVASLEPESVSAVITSPPYPNEKDYTRITRLESVLLGFITSKQELQALKQRLVRSNTRNVFRGDDDDAWIEDNKEVQRLAAEIEARRLQLGKTSGFEKQYARVTKQYFGGMARHLAELRRALHPGARLAYVVGDQASYFRVMIHTGELLAGIAQSLGYQVVGIDLFRTRMATATKTQLREEVVVLRWPGEARQLGNGCTPP